MAKEEQLNPEDTRLLPDQRRLLADLERLRDKLEALIIKHDLSPQSEAQVRAMRMAYQGIADLAAAYCVDPARHRFVTLDILTGTVTNQVYTYVQPLQWTTPDGGIYHFDDEFQVTTFAGAFTFGGKEDDDEEEE